MNLMTMTAVSDCQLGDLSPCFDWNKYARLSVVFWMICFREFLFTMDFVNDNVGVLTRPTRIFENFAGHLFALPFCTFADLYSLILK